MPAYSFTNRYSGIAHQPIAVATMETLEGRRLFSAGQLDPTFGVGGFAQGEWFVIGQATATALQSDGKIVVAGRSSVGGISLSRFNANGSLDRAFGKNGRLADEAAPGFDIGATSVAVQRDGKIVVGGSGTDASDPLYGHFLLARFLSNGKADTTFGNNGVVFSSAPRGGGNALAIQSDGKIVLAGHAYVTNADPTHSDEFAVERFNTNGSLDKTFGINGNVILRHANNGGYLTANALAIHQIKRDRSDFCLETQQTYVWPSY